MGYFNEIILKSNKLLFCVGFCLLLDTVCLFSQEGKATISGFIENSNSGERLIGANIYNSLNLNGSISNNYGFYSLTLEKGPCQLKASYVGFKIFETAINLTQDTVIDISLVPSLQIEEVIITSKRTRFLDAQTSKIDIPIKTIKTLPVILGEQDILKTIQLMPGIQGGIEGTAGIHVRGGSPDQNLILLDGVPVYNVNHLFGVFSVFNTDAIKSATLIKGGFPANYGGRVSSVLDIRMKEGNMKEMHGSISVGLISSKFMLEGPLKTGKTSFLVTARRTYFDLLAYPIIKASNPGTTFGYFFHDVNAKINHVFSPKNRLYYSFYTGKDKYYDKDGQKKPFLEETTHTTIDNQLGWGNFTNSLRWNHVFANRLFSNTTLALSRYRYFNKSSETEEIESTGELTKKNELGINSGILDFSLNMDFEYAVSPKIALKFGQFNSLRIYTPGVNTVFVVDLESLFDLDTAFNQQKHRSFETGFYVQGNFEPCSKTHLSLGLRNAYYTHGSKTYPSLEPRVSARYLLAPDISIKASYMQAMQPIHLLTNTGIGFPTDLWVPATENIKPVSSSQYALGTAFRVRNLEFEVEAFYKEMLGLLEYKEGTSWKTNTIWEEKVEQGKGWARGVELFAKKNTGKTTGWLGYTLSKTDRQFENISFGKIFPYKYDRRHYVNLVGNRKINDRVDIGAVWVFATGWAFTLPTEYYESARYFYDDVWKMTGGDYSVRYFEHRNNYRMTPYHRLDINLGFTKEKPKFTRKWAVGVYNAYCHQNAFSVYYHEGQLTMVSVLFFMPFVNYEISF